MDKYIDTHCHIIPWVDDGSENMKESRAMLKMSYDEGIRCIIATPHHHPLRGRADLEVIRHNIKLVRKEAVKIDKDFKVFLGMEVFFTHDVPDKIANGTVIGFNNKKVILLEFSPSDEFSHIVQAVKLVQSSGVDVVMAHCERYMCLLKDFEKVRYLMRLGVKLQVNTGSITGKSGRKVQKFVKHLMEEDFVFCVGTDAHNTDSRPPEMKDAADYVKKNYGISYMRKIFYINPANLLKSSK